jgi:hypothetical protein
VIWGQSKGPIADILAEVKKLHINDSCFGIEWERNSNEERGYATGRRKKIFV